MGLNLSNIYGACLCPVRYFSGKQTLSIILVCCLISTPNIAASLYCQFFYFLINGIYEEGTWEFWTAIIFISLRIFDTLVTFALIGVAYHMNVPRYPLKILILWQIPIGAPLASFELILMIILTNVNTLMEVVIILKLVWGLIIRGFLIIVLIYFYRQICSVIMTKLHNHCRDIRKSTSEELDPTYLNQNEFEQFVLSPLSVFIDKSACKGEGEFGSVFEGTWKGKKVAVKICKCGDADFQSLLQDVKTRISAGNHENIVKFFGVTSHTDFEGFRDPLCLLMDLCDNESLDNYLTSHRSTFVELEIEEDNNSVVKVVVGSKMVYVNLDMHGTHSTIDLLRISREIITGMEYLICKKIIHGDLAARNVLLTANLRAKLTDFGMSRRLYNYEMYYRLNETKGFLPWRWMSIESLEDFKFSEKSDVWSYGVLLWEIFTLGEFPYRDVEWKIDFVSDLKNGFRLQKPNYAPKFIYELMKKCWRTESDQRLSFAEIREQFEKYDFDQIQNLTNVQSK